MDDVTALPPRRSRASLGWVATAMLVAILLFPFAFAYYVVESRAAISEWNELGGSIDSGETRIDLLSVDRRSAPVDRILPSLRRMRWLPGCTGFGIAQCDYSPSEIDRMTLAFRPVDFGAVNSELNDDCLETLATISCLRSVRIQGESEVTIEGVRDLLASGWVVKVYVERSAFDDRRLRELEGEFDGRLIVWNQ